ncbi:MAG: acyltransferase family protein [Ilumatobacteraceae bacterium]
MGTDIRLAPPLGHRPPLDGVRALAVLLVAGVHTKPPLVPGGSIGVDVFFVLSGFLITTLLLEERDGNERIQFGRFYARRALRLLPALLALVAVVTLWAVVVASPGTRRDALHEVLAAITYTRNLPVWDGTPGTLLGHTWSLAVEEQFYLLWPLVLTVLVKPRRGATTLAVLFVALAAVAGTLRVNGVAGPGLALVQRPEALLLGAALALVRREHWDRVTGWVGDRGAALVVLGALGLVATALWDGADTIDSVGFSLAAALSVCLIAGLLLVGDGRPGAWFRHPAAMWLGRRSYGFYLWHMPVLRWVDDRLVGRSGAVRIPIGLGLALVATIVSYRFVEQPALRWKERFRPAQRVPAAVALGPSAR